jgi:hypothetical protein
VGRSSHLPNVTGLALLLSTVVLIAQEASVKHDEPTPTLHVYTNSIQIPTLVLSSKRELLTTPIVANRFSVSIDNGPWFRATHARREGDDPISLSILIDANGDSARLIQGVEETITAVDWLSLRPQDHISIYGLDCSLVVLLDNKPADASLATEAAKAFASWEQHRQLVRDGDCKVPAHLWDSLAHMSGELHKQPGLRVLLAVSQGKDTGSKRTWNEVRDYAESVTVTVFGMSEVTARPPGGAQIAVVLNPGQTDTPNNAPQSVPSFLWTTEEPFHQVCELSGGMVFPARPKDVSESMKTFVRTVRDRYIVEFPRPSNATSGKHSIRVKVARGDSYFIRSAGISVPTPDPKVLADPTTVSAGPKDTPEMGTRKILMKPQ